MPTFIPSDSVAYAKFMIKEMPLDDISVRVCDDIAKMIWMAAPWSWTLASLDAAGVPIVAGTQDYTVTLPMDFNYLERCYLWDGTQQINLGVEAKLPTSGRTQNIPSKISSEGSVLRLYPIPNRNATLVSIYKKLYTPIVSGNINSAGALIMPDEWAYVFSEGVLWKAFVYGDDRRAGEVTMTSDGKRQYTGQAAVFMAAIQDMREAEKAFRQPPADNAQQHG